MPLKNNKTSGKRFCGKYFLFNWRNLLYKKLFQKQVGICINFLKI